MSQSWLTPKPRWWWVTEEHRVIWHKHPAALLSLDLLLWGSSCAKNNSIQLEPIWTNRSSNQSECDLQREHERCLCMFAYEQPAARMHVPAWRRTGRKGQQGRHKQKFGEELAVKWKLVSEFLWLFHQRKKELNNRRQQLKKERREESHSIFY